MRRLIVGCLCSLSLIAVGGAVAQTAAPAPTAAPTGPAPVGPARGGPAQGGPTTGNKPGTRSTTQQNPQVNTPEQLAPNPRPTNQPLPTGLNRNDLVPNGGGPGGVGGGPGNNPAGVGGGPTGFGGGSGRTSNDGVQGGSFLTGTGVGVTGTGSTLNGAGGGRGARTNEFGNPRPTPIDHSGTAIDHSTPNP